MFRIGASTMILAMSCVIEYHNEEPVQGSFSGPAILGKARCKESEKAAGAGGCQM